MGFFHTLGKATSYETKKYEKKYLEVQMDFWYMIICEFYLRDCRRKQSRIAI